jgi:phenylalanyl-tRNA synthetase beta subunit
LTLNSDDATLAEDQIEKVVKAVVDQLVSAVGVRQRT